MTKLALPLVIPYDHPAYVGHFPGHPILPGVVLLDEVQHAVGLREELPIAFTVIRAAKFPSSVKPGETLRLAYDTTTGAGYQFEVLAGTRVVASGILTFNRNGLESGNS
jgi:3-hydroxyacyl-[acyl-carrier-protein] dehydratase